MSNRSFREYVDTGCVAPSDPAARKIDASITSSQEGDGIFSASSRFAEGPPGYRPNLNIALAIPIRQIRNQMAILRSYHPLLQSPR